ncbi:hypothetical protein KY338_06960 [Candidatus Woesearchaeota archaeon]|nr:hypothetical protein [Candidatus Woesearchaeota archaeon]MBW3006266.1 hypothetical protein [Candidatus Woesearchaeota archaeon]
MGLFEQIDRYKKATPTEQREMLGERLQKKEYAQLCAFYSYGVAHPDGTLDATPFTELAEKDPAFKIYFQRFVHFTEVNRERQDNILNMMREQKRYKEIAEIYEACTAGGMEMGFYAMFQMMGREDKAFGKFWEEYTSQDHKKFDLTFLENHLESIVEAAQAIIDGEIESAESQWPRVYSICKKMHSLTRDIDYPYRERLLSYVQGKTGAEELPEAAKEFINSGVAEFLQAFEGEDEHFEGFADWEQREVEGRKALDDFFGV